MKNLAKVLLFIFVLLSFVAAGTNLSFAKESKQEKCPAMGGPINKNVYADYKGKRVYFCCKGCIKEFEKDPDKYIKKLQKQGVVLEEAPKSD